MLGKQHVSITLATIIPLLLPMLLYDSNYQLYSISILIAVLIGSLTPDADCGGKSKLYYDFRFVHDIMIPLQKSVVWIFNRSSVKNKFNLECEVNNKHRGIMHAPVGIVISSLLLTLIASIFTLIFYIESTIFVTFSVFVGLLTGQFLHLVEDSCTVSGINWKFPFGTRELKGKIYTFSKIEGKKDIRPTIYEYSLWSITALLLMGNAFDKISLTQFTIYPLILLALVLAWILIIFTAKSDFDFWYQDIEKIKQIKKTARKIGK